MTTIVGIDPGPTPGLVLLECVEMPRRLCETGTDRVLMTAEVVQCTAGVLFDVLAGIEQQRDGIDLIAAERFVVSRRSGRSSTAGAGAETRDQVGALQRVYPALVLRAAGEVKPWATDARLNAAGLLDPCKGLRHARDAARHALFAACRDLGMPDPLSRHQGKASAR